jgi:hypothetical protein
LQVFEPIDKLSLFGQDPFNDFQGGATYYIATGDSGQGMRLPPVTPAAATLPSKTQAASVCFAVTKAEVPTYCYHAHGNAIPLFLL